MDSVLIKYYNSLANQYHDIKMPYLLFEIVPLTYVHPLTSKPLHCQFQCLTYPWYDGTVIAMSHTLYCFDINFTSFIHICIMMLNALPQTFLLTQ